MLTLRVSAFSFAWEEGLEIKEGLLEDSFDSLTGATRFDYVFLCFWADGMIFFFSKFHSMLSLAWDSSDLRLSISISA